MTFQDIFNEVIRELNIELMPNTRISSIVIQNKINEAIRWLTDTLWRINPDEIRAVLTNTKTVSLTTGTINFDDILLIDKIYYSDRIVRLIPQEEFTVRDRTWTFYRNIDDILYGTIRGGKLKILGVSSGTATINYIKIPTEFIIGQNDTSSPELPPKYHPAIVYYACYLICLMPDSTMEQYANAYFQKVMNMLGVQAQNEARNS